MQTVIPNKIRELLADNIRADVDGDGEELRESLKEFGWVKELPALADENGKVLVGNRRMRLAKELGIEPVVRTVTFGNGDAADAKRVRLAIASNIGGKPMTKKDRQRIAEHLYGEGEWTMQRIAEALNVTPKTISKDLAGFVPPVQTSRPKGGRPKEVRREPKTRKQKGAPAVQPSLAQVVPNPDFQIEPETAGRDLEIERGEGIAPAVAADPQEKPSTGAMGPEKGAQPETEAETKSVDPNGARLLDVLHDFEQSYVKRDPIVLLATVSGELQDEVRRVASVVADWLNRLSKSAGFDDTIEPADGVGQLVGHEKETGTANKQVGLSKTTAVCPTVAASDPWDTVGPIPERLRRSAPERARKTTTSKRRDAGNEQSGI